MTVKRQCGIKVILTDLLSRFVFFVYEVLNASGGCRKLVRTCNVRKKAETGKLSQRIVGKTRNSHLGDENHFFSEGKMFDFFKRSSPTGMKRSRLVCLHRTALKSVGLSSLFRRQSEDIKF